MVRLSHNDYRAALSALEKIYSIGNVEHFPAGVLSTLKQTLSCNTICYNEITLPDSMTTWITEPADALPGPVQREAFMRNYTQHPALTHYAQTGDGRSYRISDFVSRRRFHSLTLYNEYYRQSNVEYQLVGALMLSKSRMAGIALDRDRTDFTERERLILDLLRLHMAQEYQNLQARSLMLGVVEESGKKLFTINRSGQVQETREDIWRLISEYFNVRGTYRCLPDKLKSWMNYERSRWRDGNISALSAPLVVSKDNRRLTVRFLWGGEMAGEDLLLFEEESCPVAGTEKLTARESEILTWLSHGKTNAEIGEALSISPRTVKKHLEHIFGKLRVHRRTAAVARFHGL